MYGLLYYFCQRCENLESPSLAFSARISALQSMAIIDDIIMSATVSAPSFSDDDRDYAYAHSAQQPLDYFAQGCIRACRAAPKERSGKTAIEASPPVIFLRGY